MCCNAMYFYLRIYCTVPLSCLPEFWVFTLQCVLCSLCKNRKLLCLLVCVSLQKAYKRRGESSDAVSEVYYKNMVLMMLCILIIMA